MVPNQIQNTLELFKIVIDGDDDDATRLVPLCVLNLPTLNEHASIFRLGCRAEPNPIGLGALPIPAPSRRPFRDKAEDAIILFSMEIEDVPPDGEQHRHPEMHSFTFIVHRRALAAHIPAKHHSCAPYCCSVVPPGEPVQVPWDAWGIAATRWFEDGVSLMRRITTTAGQHTVTMEGSAPTPIMVRDFNPYAVHAACARAAAAATAKANAGSSNRQSLREELQQAPQGHNWSEQLANGNRMTFKVEESVLPVGNKFQEDVRSALPYVEVVTRAKYSYSGVLIDEERILGLKVRFHPRIY